MRSLAIVASLALSSILLTPPPLAAQPRTLDTRILTYVPGVGLEVGSGYDPVALTVKTVPCINFDAKDMKRFDIDPGNESASFHRVVTDSDHITNMFKFTYAESMDAGIFSASGNFSLANNVTYDTSHIRVLGYRRIVQADTKIIQNVSLRPEAAKLMTTDYESFRKSCGDFFVAGYAFGGLYAAVIDIDKSALGVTVETEASMSEKMNDVFTSESVDIGMQDTFDRLSKHGALSITETSSGGHITAATSVKTLKENYRHFDDSVTAAPSKLRVILTPYTQLISADSGTVLPNVAQMEDNAALYYEYQTLMNALRSITRRPFQYSLNTPAGNRWTVADIQGLMNEVSGSMDKIVKVMGPCSTATGICPDMRAVLPKLPSSYTSSIPTFLGSPQICFDVARRMKTPKDGPATLFYQGDPDKPFDVICRGMGTTYPHAYLPLVLHAPPDASGNGANFSQASLHPGNPLLVTTFTALRIDPQSLIVTTDDYTYATSNGFVEGPDLRQEPYATPFACDRHICDWMKADIDLRGTPFAVDSKTTWKAVGSHAPDDGGGSTTGTDSNQKWMITSPCGDCAWLQPSPLTLTYIGGYVPDTNPQLVRAAAKATAVPRRGKAQ